MKTFATIAAALALSATAAFAAQGDKITAMGYGPTQHHAKIVTIQTWTTAAHDSYGYADWNTAYIGQMECVQNYATTNEKFSTLSREIIKIGGDQSAPWSCIVSGYQDVKTSYNGGFYNGGGFKKNTGHTGGYTGYTGGYTGHASGYTGTPVYKY